MGEASKSAWRSWHAARPEELAKRRGHADNALASRADRTINKLCTQRPDGNGKVQDSITGSERLTVRGTGQIRCIASYEKFKTERSGVTSASLNPMDEPGSGTATPVVGANAAAALSLAPTLAQRGAWRWWWTGARTTNRQRAKRTWCCWRSRYESAARPFSAM